MLPNLFHIFQHLNRRDFWHDGTKYYISEVEFTQVSSDILLNGFMTAELKITKIFCVQSINYSPKGYRQGRLARL
jgi:hypothetical protein